MSPALDNGDAWSRSGSTGNELGWGLVDHHGRLEFPNDLEHPFHRNVPLRRLVVFVKGDRPLRIEGVGPGGEWIPNDLEGSGVGRAFPWALSRSRV